MAWEGVERMRRACASAPAPALFENKAWHDAIWPGAAEAARPGEWSGCQSEKVAGTRVYTGVPWTPDSGFTAHPEPCPLHLTTGSLLKLFTFLAPPQILASASQAEALT